MKLFKDLSTNLNKILMQIEKSKIQLENTVSSGKTSIANIKDVNSNIKDLKLNNDKSNKPFEESKISLNQLLKITDNYLKNSTPEKLLKVKNQIDISNNDLTKATTIFSENKTFANKVVVSFNKYKNNDFISNIKKLIEWNQRLIASLNKNINLVKSVGKLKIKTQTKSREVYSSESPTPSPTCEKLKEELAYEIKQRESFINKINAALLLIEATIPIAQKNKDEYEKQASYEDEIIKFLEDSSDLQQGAFNNYKLRQEKVDNSNEEIKKSYAELGKIIINNPSIKAIKNKLLTIERITKQRDLNLHALENAILNLGSGTKQGIDENKKITKEARDVFIKKNTDIFYKMVDSQNVIKEQKRDIPFYLQVVINTDISIKDLEIEIKVKNCP
jgi:hypothetical protein